MKAAPKQANNDSNRASAEATQGNWEKQSAQTAAGNSRTAAAQQARISGINDSPRMLAQRRQIEGYLGTGQPPISEPAPPTSPIAQQPIQRLEKPDDEEEEVLQPKFASEPPTQQERQTSPKSNNTGLPDNLKSGIEALSGLSMDNVKVHYNSSQPAQLNALAYAQGTDIHVAPGQEQHLAHEAWHVVQQAQGRVKPTMQAKGMPINDDKGLEREADVMGARAVQMKANKKQGVPPIMMSKCSVTQFILSAKEEDELKAYVKEKKYPQISKEHRDTAAAKADLGAAKQYLDSIYAPKNPNSSSSSSSSSSNNKSAGPTSLNDGKKSKSPQSNVKVTPVTSTPPPTPSSWSTGNLIIGSKQNNTNNQPLDVEEYDEKFNNNDIKNLINTSQGFTVRSIEPDGNSTKNTVYYKIIVAGPIKPPQLGLLKYQREIYTLYLHCHPSPTDSNWLHIKATHGGTPGNKVDPTNWLFKDYKKMLNDGIANWANEHKLTAKPTCKF